MKQMIPYISPEGKIYINIEDVMYVLKGIIEAGYNDKADTSLIEMAFVWFGEQAEKIEKEQREARAKQFNQHRQKLEKFWEKYKIEHGKPTDQTGNQSKENTVVSKANQKENTEESKTESTDSNDR